MKRIISISLATILLFSSFGFNWATHYCGGVAVESALVIGHSDLDCGMAKMDKSCEASTSTATLKTQECCQNEVLQLNIGDELQRAEVFETSLNLTFFTAFTISVANQFSTEEVIVNTLFSYIPPLLSEDISVLIQSFLI